MFRSSQKKLPQKLVQDLSRREGELSEKIEKGKIQQIKLESELEKQLQILREKEHFTDGLHLIDFEKLKIENQSLNEKIEQRSEDIFKLQKKNHLNLLITAHIQEKLQNEEQLIQDLQAEYQQYLRVYNEKKKKIPSLESQLNKLVKKRQVLKQETGIVKNDFLKMDFIKRKKNIENLTLEKSSLEVT